MAAFYLFLLLTYYSCTLLAWFAAGDFIVYGSGLSYWYVQYAIQVLGVVVFVEAAAVAMLMTQLLVTSSATPLLTTFKCDSNSIAADMRLLGITQSPVITPFTGTFHTLGSAPTEVNSRNNHTYI